MKKNNISPADPTAPLLSEHQREGLDIYAEEFAGFLTKLAAAKQKRDALKQKAESDAARADEVREGRIVMEGKVQSGLDEEAILAHLQKADSALIFSRGAAREAEAEVGRIEELVGHLKTDFIRRWRPILVSLRKEEEEAWEVFFRSHFDPRAPMGREKTLMIRASVAISWIDRILNALELFSRARPADFVAAEAATIIKKMKSSPNQS